MAITTSKRLIIGIMTGTSMDGVDAVLARFDDARPSLIQAISLPYPFGLRAQCLALNQAGDNEIHHAAASANAVSDLYGEAVHVLLRQSGCAPHDIAAIGAHGQTVRHRPELGYSVQLLNGARLAELTQITTICDFRARDVAAGGQGAPLVPAFHAAIFATTSARVILNLGGIANITALPAQGRGTMGFDTGPANILLDAWCQRHRSDAYDHDGHWAQQGQVVSELLTQMLAEPFFGAAPPKSTGRDLFSLQWLARFSPEQYKPCDVQATLLALTVQSVADAINRLQPRPRDVLVCGGGAYNSAMMALLQKALDPIPVGTTATVGVDPQQVEALAFAWLAVQALDKRPGNLPAVTGARGLRVLGAIHQA